MKFFNLLAIGIGGALGTISRYYLNISLVDNDYSLSTVLVNLLGSLLLGFLTGWFVYEKTKEWLKLGLGVGFCGGFTTMSTLAADTFFLAKNTTMEMAILYTSISVFGGLILALIGYLSGLGLGKYKYIKGLVDP